MPINLTIGKANHVHMYNGPVQITYTTDSTGNTQRTVVAALATDGGNEAATGNSLGQPAFEDGPQSSSPTQTAADGGGRSARGHPVCGPSDGDGEHSGLGFGAGAVGGGVPIPATDQSGGSQHEEGAVGGQDLQQDSEPLQPIQRSSFDPSKVYPMNTTPRGMILIINNERFEHMPNRDGTMEDCETLRGLFENTLNFTVKIEANCTAERMRDILAKFAQDVQLKSVSALTVAILSHGGAGDIIYGTDGRLQSDRPVPGTYIEKDDLRTIFSGIACPYMKDKPKIFIVQACRGILEDTPRGPRAHCDAPCIEYPTDGANLADQYFIYATVANYVAYRNVFVKLLANVFREQARYLHIKDLATELCHAMKKKRLDSDDERVFTISDSGGPLTKHFFFNPPS